MDWLRTFVRKRPLTIAYVLYGLGFATGGYLLWYQAEQTKYDQCVNSQEDRGALRDAIRASYSGSGAIRLSGFPSFQNLDEATKAWVLDIEEASSSATGRTERMNELLETVPIPECEEPGWL